MPGVDKPLVIDRLKDWGFWLRTARSPSQKFTVSSLDSPLAKKRIVKAVYRSESAENLDMIMSLHLPRLSIDTLEMYYAKKAPSIMAATALGVSVRTYTAKRYEAESMLWGVLSAINTKLMQKSA